MPSGITLLSSLRNDPPTAGEIRDMVFNAALADDPDREVVRALVRCYMTVSATEAEAEGEDTDWEVISDDENWDAEKMYRKYIVAGYRQGLKLTPEQADDDSIYESCTWYDYGKTTWPDRLLAEVAFVRGYRDAREAKAMYDYVANMDAQHGKDWWKDPEKVKEF